MMPLEVLIFGMAWRYLMHDYLSRSLPAGLDERVAEIAIFS